MKTIHPLLAAALALTIVGCDDQMAGVAPERAFLDGTTDDPEIGIVVHSLERSFRMFQLGSPTTSRVVALGASSAVTPVGLSSRGKLAAVPLGNAASVAIIDVQGERIDRFFLFAGGNATGSAFVDDEMVVAANLEDDLVGLFAVDQASDEITQTVAVAPAPTAVAAVNGTAFVLSGNLDDSFAPLGDGVVTAIDPATMQALGTVETGGTNPTAMAAGPDGRLYVLNTENFVDPGSLAIIDPAGPTLVDVIAGMGVGPGHIAIDDAGLAYISGFFFGTIVWDTKTQSFVRGPDHSVCARLASGECRGAFGTATSANGDLYQLFFGSPSEDLPPWIFVYSAGTFALVDSIATGQGPAAMEIRTFE